MEVCRRLRIKKDTPILIDFTELINPEIKKQILIDKRGKNERKNKRIYC